MKYTPLVLFTALLAPPLFADAGPHIIPAGSLIGCTLSEPRVSSKTTAIGDPILCQVGYSERYGRSTLPYHSYLVGRFEDYKDPGHFVGKGWMELKFDRMVIEPDTVIPVDARVVDVPGYKVDAQGRILGKGHVARDITLWSIPILWPIDLLMLPSRGPRPTLKGEARLTLKVMDDMEIPATGPQPQADPYGLMHRQPSAEMAPPPPMQDQQPAPDMAYGPNDQPQPEPAPEMAYGPDNQQQAPSYAYPPPMPPPAPMPYPYAPPVVVAPPPVMAYGSIMVGPGWGYAPRVYAARPGYGYGFRGGYGPARPIAPRSYAYGGYGGARAGYGARPGMQAYGGRSGMGGGYGARGGMSARGGGGSRAYGR